MRRAHGTPYFECTCGMRVSGHLARASHRRACQHGQWLSTVEAYDRRVAYTLELISAAEGAQAGEDTGKSPDQAVR